MVPCWSPAGTSGTLPLGTGSKGCATPCILGGRMSWVIVGGFDVCGGNRVIVMGVGESK